MFDLYWESNSIPIFGGLQADLLGESGGADAPPGSKLGFVFSQPRASTQFCGVLWIVALQGSKGGVRHGLSHRLSHNWLLLLAWPDYG